MKWGSMTSQLDHDSTTGPGSSNDKLGGRGNALDRVSLGRQLEIGTFGISCHGMTHSDGADLLGASMQLEGRRETRLSLLAGACWEQPSSP
eukprot:scaffold3415_cov101-Cylindrotheca_fusiformis.AAC.1